MNKAQYYNDNKITFGLWKMVVLSRDSENVLLMSQNLEKKNDFNINNIGVVLFNNKAIYIHIRSTLYMYDHFH